MTVSYMIDVSAYQGRKDWKALGVHAGMAKASEGQHSRDTRFAGHITDIKAAGLVPGAYHFAWPNQDAATEAANYVGVVKGSRVKGFLHVLDLERYSDGRNYSGRSAAQIKAYATAWIAAVKKAFPGDKVGVYTSADDLGKGHYPGNSDFLWYPAYPVQGRTFAQAAAVARPEPHGYKPWGWQFTSQPIDRSIIYMTPAALKAWAAGTPTAPVTNPTKPVTSGGTAKEDDVDPFDVWAYKGKLNGKKDTRDAYAYLRDSEAKITALGKKVDTLTSTVNTQGQALKAMADALATGTDGAKVAAALDRMTAAFAAAHPADDDTADGE